MKRAQLIFHLSLGFSLSAAGCQSGGQGQETKGSEDADPKETSTTEQEDTESTTEPEGTGTQEDDSGDSPATSDSSSGQDGLTPAAYCEAFAKVVCKGDADCCEDDAKKFESEQSCGTELEKRCEKDILVLVNDKRTGFDPKVAKTQLDRLADLVSSCDLKTAQWFTGQSGLMAMYQGTVDEGESCTPSGNEDAAAMLSCKDDGFCLLSPIPLSGTCSAKGRKQGDTCYAHVECIDGLYCTAPENGVGKCEARAANGETCEDGFWCDSLYCESSKCVEATKDRVYCAK